MVIQKGHEWGQLVARPNDLCVVADDSQASVYLKKHLKSSANKIELAILTSGLARTLGVSGAKPTNKTMLRTEFDVIEATFSNHGPHSSDHRNCFLAQEYFLGYAFLRSNWLKGSITGVLNSSFVKNRNWAPRAHPNDGKLDVIIFDGSMSLRQRLSALRLMKSGSHLPHPKIQYQQMSEYEAEIEDRLFLYIDGQRIGKVSNCSFRVLPDAVNLFW